MVHVTWPRPIQGNFVIRGLTLTTINLATKFQVSIFTYYKDMKGDTKNQK